MPYIPAERRVIINSELVYSTTTTTGRIRHRTRNITAGNVLLLYSVSDAPLYDKTAIHTYTCSFRIPSRRHRVFPIRDCLTKSVDPTQTLVSADGSTSSNATRIYKTRVRGPPFETLFTLNHPKRSHERLPPASYCFELDEDP